MVFNYLSGIKAKNLANNRGKKTADNYHISVNENQRNKPQIQVIGPSSEKEEGTTIGGSLKEESIVAKRDKKGKEKESVGSKVVSVADVLRADEVGLMSCSREEEREIADATVIVKREEEKGLNQQDLLCRRRKRGRRLKEEVKLKK